MQNRFFNNFMTAVKDYSSWSTLLIVMLMITSLIVAPHFAHQHGIDFKQITKPFLIYTLMAFLSYLFLVMLTSFYDHTKLRWPYVFVSAFFPALIGMYLMYWQRLLKQNASFPDERVISFFEMLVSAYFYMPFTIVVALLCVFTKSERKAAADRLRHATYKERQQRDLAEMQLRVLQAQIEPHFLYNTMAHLGILIHDEPNTATRFLDRFITYLRGVSPIVSKSLVPLKTELELYKSYLDVQSIRFENKISYDIQQNGLRDDLEIPSFILLTLAENAMKHALESSTEGGHISLDFKLDNNKFIITHINSGQTLNPDWEPGIGLRNIQERLASLYMENAKFTLESTDNSETKATIEIPFTS